MAYAENDQEVQATCRGIPGGTPEARVDGGPQYPDRFSLGGAEDAELMQRFAKELVALQPDLIFRKTPTTTASAATNAHHPHCFRDCCRSGRQRLRHELPAAGRQRHWFHHLEPTMAGKWLELLKEIAPRVNRVAVAVQPGNGDICRIFT